MECRLCVKTDKNHLERMVREVNILQKLWKIHKGELSEEEFRSLYLNGKLLSWLEGRRKVNE